MTDVAIEVENVWKHFRRGEVNDSLRDFIPAVAKRFFGRRKQSLELGADDFWALRDVSFQARCGEVLGIIGPNGAGKSTLLKALARIHKPNRGRIRVNGRLRALIEIGAGFHPDLTGRENVYFNGTILGMRKREITAKFDDIVEFAGIQEFIDTPVKRYSTGMQARLGFAVAAHLDPEILVVDEVLAVGDVEFQQKCLGTMSDVGRGGRTVLFVSHNMSAVRSLCDTAIMLDHGCIVASGSAGEVVESYLQGTGSGVCAGQGTLDDRPEWPLWVSSIKTLDHDSKMTSAFPDTASIMVEVAGNVRQLNEKYIVAIDVRNADHFLLFRTHSFEQPESFRIISKLGDFRLRCTIPANLLLPGTYRIGLVTAIAKQCEFQSMPSVLSFDVFREDPLQGKVGSKRGVIAPRCNWRSV